jgi:hypothetical protein
MLVVLACFVRGTVLPRFLPIPDIAFTLFVVLAALMTAGLVMASGRRCRWSWILVVLAFAAGLCQAEQFGNAALHWVGLALVIIAAGPVMVNPVAIALRSAAWRLTVRGLTSLTAIFVIWYILHLPSFGVGFSSFMIHCMLLGPIAGMGVCIASARAMHGRSWRWGLLAFLGFLPILASGSRAAALACLAGVSFVLIRRKPILGLGFLLLCGVLIVGFLSRGRDTENSADSLTGELSHKGNLNSRTDLWASRLLEFRSSPICGIGIMMGTGSGVTAKETGAIRVEPGSSYLAVLAMTGLVGSVSFCLALGLLLFRFIVSHKNTGLDKDILSVVGIYLAVHANAEGWIFAFGTPMCFLFWLWLGNVGDVGNFTTHPYSKRAKPRGYRRGRQGGHSAEESHSVMTSG